MELESSIPCSQQSATGLYPEPDESSSHLLTLFLQDDLILSSHLCLGLQICISRSVMYFLFTCLPGLHSPSMLGTHPSGQVHVIVRTGTVSSTLHCAVGEHGDSFLQGSTHSFLIQAKRLGQSTSILHSGSSGGGGARSQYASGFPIGKCSGHRQPAAWFWV